jgi:hypothetical protein
LYAIKSVSIIRNIFIAAFLAMNFLAVVSSQILPLNFKFQREFENLRANHLVQQYAYYTGLNNRWAMFSTIADFNWELIFTGISSESKFTVWKYPDPESKYSQSYRFYEIKSAKFHLNMYGNKNLRHRFAVYLCRKNVGVTAIQVSIKYATLNPPNLALASGVSRRDLIENIWETISCPKV